MGFFLHGWDRVGSKGKDRVGLWDFCKAEDVDLVSGSQTIGESLVLSIHQHVQVPKMGVLTYVSSM